MDLCGSCVSCMCALTCFADPLQVAVELSLDLLLSPQLEELAPVLDSLSLFGKFTVGELVKNTFNVNIQVHKRENLKKMNIEWALTLRVHPAPG